jgi:hypothetical protein
METEQQTSSKGLLPKAKAEVDRVHENQAMR